MDKVLALHAGSRGFDSHRGHMSERFFRSNRPGYPHPVSSELENSGIRVAVGDCSVTERRRWRPPYQTGKTAHVHAKHYKHNEDGRTAPGVCGNGSVPLSHSGNVVTRIGIHTHTHTRKNDIPYNFKKIVVRYKKIGYNINVMRQTACLVVNPIKVNSFAYLFNCMTVGRTSD